ncbi:MAG: hypothetical protein F4154_04175 [Candidatus Dadabacteria bacterium]|nr:hypothetical protein [Candidatus Dadabacteria bacterium]
MKKSFLIISFVFLAACIAEESAVELDGPVLETENFDGSVDFNGAVVNTANFPVQSVYVVIFVKDSDGNALAATSALVEEGDILDPAQSFFFTASFDNLPPEAHSREVQIYYDLLEE